MLAQVSGREKAAPAVGKALQSSAPHVLREKLAPLGFYV